MSMDAGKPAQLQVEMDEVVIIFFAAIIGSEISLRIFAMRSPPPSRFRNRDVNSSR
jgi:hypothetical protein